MGGGNSAPLPPYSVPLQDEKNETIYRSPIVAKGDLMSSPDPENIKTLQDIFLYSSKKYANNNFLGTRKGNSYEFKTYSQVNELATAFGSGLINLNLLEENIETDLVLKFLGVYSKNREEYIILDMACVLFNVTSVPIYDTLGIQALEFILGQTNLKVMAASLETIQKWIETKIFGQIKLITFDYVIAEGKKTIQKNSPVNPNDLYVFSYTSGTTGNPKGAMLSHKNFVSTTAVGECLLPMINHTDVHISYLPLAHVFERLVLHVLIYKGCTIAFYNGDVQKLKEDLQIVRPTLFISVPRLLNRFYDVMTEGAKALTGCKKSLVSSAISSKLSASSRKPKYTHSFYDKIVFKKMKNALGGRCKIIACGSAPISEDVIKFLRIAMCCPFLEGYGQTEGTGASFLTSPKDWNTGHVGGPVPNTEFKLFSVPDMNYTLNDKPCPRGELGIRGPGKFVGYFKDEEKTREAIDEDGWLHTGDIVKLNPNGSITIIDRKKNIFKLSQGEYVAAEKIEMSYAKCPAIAEIFIYGDSLQSYLIAIIVPNKDELFKLLTNLKITFNDKQYSEVLKEKDVNEAVLKEMRNFEQNLQGFEKVKKIHLEENSFQAYDLLTTTFKLKRHDAKVKYLSVIEALYS